MIVAVEGQAGGDRPTPAETRVHRFAILSGLGWLIDFTTFNILAWFGVSLFLANLLGASMGVSWVFVTARATIFRSRTVPLRRAVTGYLVWNAVAIMVASFAVATIGHVLAQVADAWVPSVAGIATRPLAAPAAKIVVTPLTMYCNYVAMGLIVERRLSWR